MLREYGIEEQWLRCCWVMLILWCAKMIIEIVLREDEEQRKVKLQVVAVKRGRCWAMDRSRFSMNSTIILTKNPNTGPLDPPGGSSHLQLCYWFAAHSTKLKIGTECYKWIIREHAVIRRVYKAIMLCSSSLGDLGASRCGQVSGAHACLAAITDANRCWCWLKVREGENVKVCAARVNSCYLPPWECRLSHG